MVPRAVTDEDQVCGVDLLGLEWAEGVPVEAEVDKYPHPARGDDLESGDAQKTYLDHRILLALADDSRCANLAVKADSSLSIFSGRGVGPGRATGSG
ncbi:MAG: hypothetical protein QF701_01090 [Nitrospinota bacterium]|nr:hypothetical protein [Nitrospinota bacterium]